MGVADDATDGHPTNRSAVCIVVHLAEDRREFRMFVHGIVEAPHGV